MVFKSPYKNEHLELYIAGKLDEIPAEVLPFVKEAIESRKVAVEPFKAFEPVEVEDEGKE
jgi:hypothetical protein